MRHITKEQRYTISTMLFQGYSKQVIANCIGKDKSSIYRELKRNSDKRNGSYKNDLAENKCRERHIFKKKNFKFATSVRAKVVELIKDDYSPEQVVGYCNKIGFSCVSHERIYQHIWKDKKQKGE